MDHINTTTGISRTIAATDGELVSLGYSPKTMIAFRRVWKKVAAYASKERVDVITKDLCASFLSQIYGLPFDTKNPPYVYSMARRAAFLLLGMQDSGIIRPQIIIYERTISEHYEASVNSYIARRKRDGYDPKTIRAQFLFLERLTRFFGDSGITSLSKWTFDEIVCFLRQYKECQKGTMSCYIRYMRDYLRHAYDNGFVDTDLSMNLPYVKDNGDSGLRAIFSPAEVERLLQVIDTTNPTGKRDFAILLLAARYGIRSCDIRALEFANLNFGTNKITFVQKKTGVPIELDLLPEVGWSIIDYLKNGRPKSDSSVIFIRHVAPYTEYSNGSGFLHIFLKYMRIAGIAPPKEYHKGMHSLRFSLATNLLDQGTPLHVVSGLLGHQDLETTTVYTKVNMRQLSLCALEVPYDPEEN